MEKNSLKIEILKKEFPECFDRDGNFNIEKFGKVISPETKVFKDSYGLNWLGKSYARALAQGEPRKMLREDIEHNKKTENKDSENIYIKGDNLEVLKHLHGGYKEAIKMIYIDPPYNTKSGEFVYNDNWDFNKKELGKLVEANIIDEDEMERIKKWEGESSSHSAWLTFMYPRLYLARKLLKDDGVIFISIDDNEVAQLKLMCDEIFGEENFITNLIWKHTAQSKNDEPYFSNQYNSTMIYRKSSELEKLRLPRTEENNKNYSNPDNDINGMWRSGDVRSPSYRGTLCYEISTPSGKKIFPPANGWRWSKEAVESKFKTGEIVFNEEETKIIRKIYLKNQEGRTPENLWSDAGTTRQANKEIKDLFNNIKTFDTPKPSLFILNLLKLFKEKDYLVLDFFSGSASTAHAVNKLNLEDEGKRKWIMVQLEEEIGKKSKDAYNFCTENNLPPYITSIGIERIKRANKQILDEEEGKKENFDREHAEKKLGFKVYKTRDKIKELEIQDEFSPDLRVYDPLHLSGNDAMDIVNTYKLQDGYPLVTSVVTENLSWEKTVIGSEGTGRYIYTSYRVEDILYLIHPISSSDVCKSIINKLDTDPEFKVGRIVVYGFTNIESKHRMELIENLKTYSNKKSAHIDFEVRY